MNPENGSIEVYRDPQAEGYASVQTATRGNTVTALNLPSASFRVDDILG
mgnify:CR=1 FL=1